MKIKSLIQSGFVLAIGIMLMSSCGKGKDERSSFTGWKYNDPDWGGVEKLDYEGQMTPPNMVLIEGGTFMMGQTSDDVMSMWNNVPRRVTVSSFYMDETEISNKAWKDYLFWTKNTYVSYPEVYRKALPDTLVWREELSMNEPYVQAYFRHPSYDDYPVVGVNWLQVNDFCDWRTDRVNEMLLIERGILNPNTADQKDSENFNSEAYLAGQYEGNVRQNLPDLATGGERKVKYEDGIMLPDFRLPTEAEWEYAALALQGNMKPNKDELIMDKKIYPWNGSGVRYKKHNKQQGFILANFKRGRGDYMGMAGNLNDHAAMPGRIRTFMPNDFGLFNMAGNVSEWVKDIYRPTTSTTLRDSENHDLNPFRGNKFKQRVLDENGNVVEKDSLGKIQYAEIPDSVFIDRDNYKKANVYNYRDGDSESVSYNYGVSTLINEKSRVIKGGSWSDRAYWLSPSTRRFFDEDKASRSIGFRCAMIRVGGPTGNEDTSGKMFKEAGKVSKRRY